MVSTLVPFFLYTLGLAQIEPGKAATMALTEPLTATIIGIMFLREPIRVSGIVGIILISLSILILNRKNNTAEDHVM